MTKEYEVQQEKTLFIRKFNELIATQQLDKKNGIVLTRSFLYTFSRHQAEFIIDRGNVDPLVVIPNYR